MPRCMLEAHAERITDKSGVAGGLDVIVRGLETEAADLVNRWLRFTYTEKLSGEGAIHIFADHPWTEALVWRPADVIGDAVGKDGYTRQSVFMGLEAGSQPRWLGSTIITTSFGALGGIFGGPLSLSAPVPAELPDVIRDVVGLLNGEVRQERHTVRPGAAADGRLIATNAIETLQQQSRRMLVDLAQWQANRNVLARDALEETLAGFAVRGVFRPLPDLDPESDHAPYWVGGLEACAGTAAQWLFKQADRGPHLRLCSCGCRLVLCEWGRRGRPQQYWPGHARSIRNPSVTSRGERSRIRRALEDAGYCRLSDQLVTAIHEQYRTVTNLRRAARRHDSFLAARIPTRVVRQLAPA